MCRDTLSSEASPLSVRSVLSAIVAVGVADVHVTGLNTFGLGRIVTVIVTRYRYVDTGRDCEVI